jgi:hypothetical protein
MKKVLIAVLILGALALGGYFYVFHKPHRDVQAEEASIELNSAELLSSFENDMAAANEKFLEKTIAVKGLIQEVQGNMLILEPGVICNMVEGFDAGAAKPGNKVIVKGRVISFDELLEEVRLDNAAITTQ